MATQKQVMGAETSFTLLQDTVQSKIIFETVI